MAQKYQKPPVSGREYVDVTREFCNITHARCERLPKRWKETILLPLIRIADEIESITRRANKIYLNEKNLSREDLIRGYGERIHLLTEAVTLFSDFDAKFERMMGKIDIGRNESLRLKNILISIIKEMQETHPEYKELTITVRSHGDEMEYISMAGNRYMKLKLTQKNINHWLDLENSSLGYIRRRIEQDKRAVAGLNKAQ